ETAKTVHFGIDANGVFKGLHSEPAPFGAILLRRAAQEYENAEALVSAEVQSIVPLMLVRYDIGLFNGEPIGAVISLTPDESPHALDFLYQYEPDASEERLAHGHSVLEALSVKGGLSELPLCAAQTKVSFLIGRSLRSFAQAGFYRYSSAWDNFFFDRRGSEIYLTDLDSSRRLAELPADIGGL